MFQSDGIQQSRWRRPNQIPKDEELEGNVPLFDPPTSPTAAARITKSAAVTAEIAFRMAGYHGTVKHVLTSVAGDGRSPPQGGGGGGVSTDDERLLPELILVVIEYLAADELLNGHYAYLYQSFGSPPRFIQLAIDNEQRSITVTRGPVMGRHSAHDPDIVNTDWFDSEIEMHNDVTRALQDILITFKYHRSTCAL